MRDCCPNIDDFVTIRAAGSMQQGLPRAALDHRLSLHHNVSHYDIIARSTVSLSSPDW